MRLGNGLAGIAETGQVKLNRVAHPSFDLGFGRPGCNTAWEVRRVG